MGAELVDRQWFNDGTADYFATIPQAKVLYRPSRWAIPLPRWGRWQPAGGIMHFANDIIATPGYLRACCAVSAQTAARHGRAALQRDEQRASIAVSIPIRGKIQTGWFPLPTPLTVQIPCNGRSAPACCPV
ncbi:MAG: hypothetical protein ACLUVV_05645 [Christensenellales bacterium]